MAKNREQFPGLKEEQRRLLIERIQAFFDEERGESLGIIAAEGMLDFFMESLAPAVYNRALEQAREWYEQRMESLGNDFYALFRKP